MPFYRDTWAEIDLDAIAYNVKQIKALHPNKDIFAVFNTNARTNIEVYSKMFDAAEEEVEKMLDIEYPIEE